MLQDDAVSYMCSHSPKLTRLSLSLCAALSAPIVDGPRLRRVELSHCEALASPSIRAPMLEELSLSGCTQLQDGYAHTSTSSGPCAFSPDFHCTRPSSLSRSLSLSLSLTEPPLDRPRVQGARGCVSRFAALEKVVDQWLHPAARCSAPAAHSRGASLRARRSSCQGRCFRPECVPIASSRCVRRIAH